MFSGEKPRSEEEKMESVVNPEQVAEQSVGNAVAAIENKDAADPVVSSRWMGGAKKFFNAQENLKDAKIIGGRSLDIARIGLFTTLFKVPLALLKFAKKAIEKKGNVGFSEGYKIGREIIPGEKESK